jgi:hypothetical protein
MLPKSAYGILTESRRQTHLHTLYISSYIASPSIGVSPGEDVQSTKKLSRSAGEETGQERAHSTEDMECWSHRTEDIERNCSTKVFLNLLMSDS